jgi:hypothetical protein
MPQYSLNIPHRLSHGLTRLTGSLNVVGFRCRSCVDGGEQKEIRKEIELDSEGKVECG